METSGAGPLVRIVKRHMHLGEAIASLHECSREAVLFAERVGGEFRPESEAVALELSESELHRPIKDVAADRAPGKEYFLEVFVALDVLDDWRSNHPNQEPMLEQIVEAIIYYAQHDAYPESFFDTNATRNNDA